MNGASLPRSSSRRPGSLSRKTLGSPGRTNTFSISTVGQRTSLRAEELRALGHVGHQQVALGAALAERAADQRLELGGAHQPPPEGLRHGAMGDVVVGGADAAGGEHQVVAPAQQIEIGGDGVHVVAADHHPLQRDPQL